MQFSNVPNFPLDLFQEENQENSKHQMHCLFHVFIPIEWYSWSTSCFTRPLTFTTKGIPETKVAIYKRDAGYCICSVTLVSRSFIDVLCNYFSFCASCYDFDLQAFAHILLHIFITNKAEFARICEILNLWGKIATLMNYIFKITVFTCFSHFLKERKCF